MWCLSCIHIFCFYFRFFLTLCLTGELCAGFRACSKRELSEVRLLSEIRWRILLNGRALDEVAWDFFKRRVMRRARPLCGRRSRLLHNVPSLGLRCGISGLNITNIDKIVFKNWQFQIKTKTRNETKRLLAVRLYKPKKLNLVYFFCDIFS